MKFDNYRILLVDDEPDLREIFKEGLEAEGFTVLEAASGREAIQLVQKEPVNSVISDVRMPDGSGLDFLEYLRNVSAEDMLVLLMTGFSDINPEEAYDRGAAAVLKKPVDPDILIQSIKQLERMKKSRHTIRPPRYRTQIAIKLKFDQIEKEAMGRLENISRGGFLAHIPDLPVELNQELKFEFSFHLDRVVKGNAIVRRVIYPTKVSPQMKLGAEFENLKGSSEESLLYLLKQLEDEVLPIL